MPEQPTSPRPKILLVDLPESVGEELRARGHNAPNGTFGQRYSVDRNTALTPLLGSVTDFSLPNYTEREIVIVDLAGPAPVPLAQAGAPAPPIGIQAIWTSRSRGVVDPRPFAMLHAGKLSERIYANGGSFICFCGPREAVRYLHGARRWAGDQPEDLELSGSFERSNWDLT